MSCEARVVGADTAPDRVPIRLAQRLSSMGFAALGILLWPIGPDTRQEPSDALPNGTNWTWIAALSLSASLALPAIASAQDAGRYGKSWVQSVYWAGLGALVLPIIFRAVWPRVARLERIYFLTLLALSTFCIKLLYQPTRFAHFDEFLHWLTAMDIMGAGRLFLDNSLLPISPSYPGIEILTTCLAHLSGLSIFGTSTVILLIVRPLFISALFLFYERVSASPQIAAIACVVYMGNSGYVFFESQYAYESLAIVLLGLALASDSIARDSPRRIYASVGLVLLFVLALSVTHHVTSYVAFGFFAALAVLQLMRSPDKSARVRPLLVAVFILISIVVWSSLGGKSIVSYLGPSLEHGVNDFLRMIQGGSGSAAKTTRKAFEAADGVRTPLMLQVIGMISVVVVALGLATGFLRALALSASGLGRAGWAALVDSVRGHFGNPRLALLTMLTLCWPITVVLRLTAGGWQIGNRMGPFVFLGVGMVTAIGVIHFWQRVLGRSTSVVIGGALAIALLGGVVTGWGFAAAGSPYRVSADAASIEPMGIETALWARKWLGRGNRFATDRTNQVLIGTYGTQVLVGSLDDEVDTSYIFIDPSLSSEEFSAIKNARIEYLLVDLRMSQALPAFGSYFGPGEDEDIHERPPDPRALLKFGDMPRVSRVYDNGWIDIFDLRGLGNDQQVSSLHN